MHAVTAAMPRAATAHPAMRASGWPQPAAREPRNAAVAAAARGPYRLCLAASHAELRAAQRLRFEVFNVDQRGGFAAAWGTGLDADPLDAVCDHLLLIDDASQRLVATCRLQTGWRALAARGYSGDRLFDLAPFEAHRGRIVEASRGCVAAGLASADVLQRLWRGIAGYAVQHGAQELLAATPIGGCDERLAAAVWRQWQSRLVPDELVTLPHAEHSGPIAGRGAAHAVLPALPSMLLARGARLAAPPALDREGGAVELLCWLDLAAAGVRGWVRG